MSHRFVSFVTTLAVVGLTAASSLAAGTTTLLDETFADDPIAGARAVVDGDAGRFSHSGGTLTASYDSALATTRLNWSIGQTLTQDDTFCFIVDFSIDSGTLSALDDNFAQFAFGLTNATTTGDDRAGGTFDDGQAAYDIVTFDYFPNTSPTFGSAETLAPTVVVNNAGTYFSSIRSVFGSDSDLTEEGPLPTDVALTATVAYDAGTRQITLTLADTGGLLDINVGGGADADATTIVLDLPGGENFAVDTFSLLLWEDNFGGGLSTTAGDLDFTRAQVLLSTIPEPTSAALLGVAMLAAGRRRRRVLG